jgi:hypothetical protein
LPQEIKHLSLWCTDLFKEYWQIEVCTVPPQKEAF